MELLKEKGEDVGREKHVPVVEITDRGIRVEVGSVPHPMEDKHYIEWIELITNGKVYRKFLNPGEGTEVIFEIKPEKFVVREYCNIHGLWTAEEE